MCSHVWWTIMDGWMEQTMRAMNLCFYPLSVCRLDVSFPSNLLWMVLVLRSQNIATASYKNTTLNILPDGCIDRSDVSSSGFSRFAPTIRINSAALLKSGYRLARTRGLIDPRALASGRRGSTQVVCCGYFSPASVVVVVV